MKKFGLIVNPKNSDALKISHEIINYLKDKIQLVLTQELVNHLDSANDRKDIKFVRLDQFDSEDLELVITVGGDGTILRTLHNCNVKIFGINAGVVGFLTEVHIQNAVESLKRILDEDYSIDKRVRLNISLNDRILEPATNEAVIHTAEIAKMRLYDIQVNGVQAQTVRADGIIISTPTGSTSYAMSVGGPILDPRVDAFIIVPIAPFKLSARPLVVPSLSTITIKILGPKRNSVLVIDGQAEYKITPNDVLTFTRSEKFAEFIRFEPNFYRLIEEKLSGQ